MSGEAGRDGGYEVRTSLTEAQKDDLVSLFAGEWWTKGRDRAVVDGLLAGSDLVVGVVDVRSGRLAGFARVITDRTYIAFIEDVIVAAGHRGRGVGRLLVETLCEAPELAGIRSLELVCQPELIPFYRRWGFTDQVGRSTLMRRTSDSALTGPADGHTGEARP